MTATNSPPTPPPTNERELQDAARTAQPVTQAAPANPAPVAQQPTVGPNQTHYEAILPQIADLVVKRNYEELIHVAESADLSARVYADTQHVSRLFVTAPLVLAYLTLDQLPTARHALTRLPDELAQTPISKALFNLLAVAWERSYELVYTRAEELFNLCQQPGPFAELRTILSGMTNSFVEAYREKIFKLLNRAYTDISAPHAQQYLGLPLDQLRSISSRYGWVYDPSSQVFTPPARGSSRFNRPTSEPSSLIQFGSVIDRIARIS